MINNIHKKYPHLAGIAGIEVLDLEFTVDLSADLGGDGVSVVVGDDGSVAVPLHVGLGHAVAAHLQRDVVVVLHRLLLQRLREHWRSGWERGENFRNGDRLWTLHNIEIILAHIIITNLF